MGRGRQKAQALDKGGVTVLCQGKLVRLRAFERADLKRCVEWFADPEVRENLYLRYPMSMDEEERWYEDYVKKLDDNRIFAIETLKGKHIGNVGLHKMDHLNRHAEIGIFIGDKASWGKGCGTEAMLLLVKFAFDEMNLHKVYLMHFEGNARGHKCYLKAGFAEEGVMRDHVFKGGRFKDQIVMSAINPAERRKGR
jgi:RimJ/RimL family protein N-acetyltransferase